jgi:hypothetical protein
VVTPEVVRSKWALVLYKFALREVEAVLDRGEPRILMVSIAGPQYVDLQIYFDDHTLALDAKRDIDQNRLLSRQHSLASIMRVLEASVK